MNSVFFTTSQIVNVSRITQDGWWIENTTEHVAKGTALGNDFTINMYTPSTEGMIARYDREHDTWSDEIKDMTWKPYWDKHGQRFVVGEPDGEYPEWAIKDRPPEHNPHTHTVLYKDNAWKVYEILIGTPYFDELGVKLLVSDFNFELPDNHSFDEPPKPREGFAIKLVDGQWSEVPDHRGKFAYVKDRDSAELVDYLIDDIGALPDTHTLLERGEFDSWLSVENRWEYDIERHRPIKRGEELHWRDSELTKVLNRIDQYQKDQEFPVELRTSPIKTEEEFLRLAQDRKTLSDYPDSDGFPFDQRPVLLGLSLSQAQE